MSNAPYPCFRAGLTRRIVGAVCLVASLVTASAAEQPSAEPIVELPKFVVTDSRALPEPESWRYASLPNIEILSSASDRATKRLVKDFQMFREALDLVWPMPPRLNQPILLILCGRAGQFEKFEPLKSDGGGMIARASLYLKGRTHSAIVIDMASSVVNVAALDVGFESTTYEDSGTISIDHNKQLYREYVHYLLGRSEPQLPVWFEEGMAQIIMSMDVNTKWIEFGRIEEGNTVSQAAAMAAVLNQAGAGGDSSDGTDLSLMATSPAEDRDFNVALARRALLPMQRMFDVQRNAPEVTNPLGNNTWAKQTYAFVHMCLYGENKRYQKPFGEFLMRCTKEPVTEEMFKQCFKMSYNDMLLLLRGYIEAPSYQGLIVQAKDKKPLFTEAKVDLREASPAEVGRIKSRAMLMAGRNDVARTELVAPYIRGDRDPQLLASLGELEHAAGKDDRARQLLTAAVAGKSTDPEAYRQLAQFLYADADAKPGAPNRQFSTAQVAAIVKLLREARKLPPPSMDTYDMLARTLARSTERMTRDDAMLLIEGAQLFPTRLKLVYEAAVVCADAGMIDAAHSLADHGLKYAPDPVAKARFQELKAGLPPLPASPAGAPAAAGAKPASSSQAGGK